MSNSNTKYTPGPWILEKSFYHDYFNLTSRDRDNYIGSVNFPEYEKSSDISLMESEANARLIAAAPDALALIIRMQVELQNVLDGNIQPGAIAFEIEQATKLIAKAEGRES